MLVAHNTVPLSLISSKVTALVRRPRGGGSRLAPPPSKSATGDHWINGVVASKSTVEDFQCPSLAASCKVRSHIWKAAAECLDVAEEHSEHSFVGQTISVHNQPPRSSQPGHPSVAGYNQYQ